MKTSDLNPGRPRSLNARILCLLISAFAFTAPAFATACNAGATSLSTYGSGGCSVGNLLFSNFSVDTTADTITGPLNTITPGANTVVLPDGNTITASASGGGLDFTTGSSLPPCTTGSFCVTGKNQSLTTTITYEVSTLDNSNTISLATLFASLHTRANTSTAAVFTEICPGAVAFSQGCGGYQVGELGAVGQNITLTNGTTTLFFTGTNKVWIRDTIYLTTNNGNGSEAAVTGFGFGGVAAPTPEPATYGMVGAALAGLGAFRLRRRKVLPKAPKS